MVISQQACKEHWGGSFDEVCLTCLQSKANIEKWVDGNITCSAMSTVVLFSTIIITLCVDVGPRNLTMWNLSLHYFLISKGLNNIFTLFFSDGQEFEMTSCSYWMRICAMSPCVPFIVKWEIQSNCWVP